MSLPVPLPIPPLLLESVPDETGFTMCQKIALRNAFKVLTPDKHKHAKEQFLCFFTDNESLIERFRNSNGHLKLDKLHHHTSMLFSTVEQMANEGLESVAQMHSIVSPVIQSHVGKGVEREDMEKIVTAMSEYTKRALENYLSPSLEMALDKIYAILVNIFD